MSYFLNLPDELILKILSYTETVDILRCGGVSKRIRIISNDSSLFQSVNLSGKIVKAYFLETVLNKDCKSLNLSNSSIQGNLTLTQKSQLIKLDLSYCHEISYDVLEELLESCHSLQILSLNGLQLSTQIYRAPLEEFCMVYFTSKNVGYRVIRLSTNQHLQVRLDSLQKLWPVFARIAEHCKFFFWRRELLLLSIEMEFSVKWTLAKWIFLWIWGVKCMDVDANIWLNP